MFDDAASATPVWTRPAVNADTDYDITLTVTANGTGTDAADGTSDTADDTETTTVLDTAPLLLLSDQVVPDGRTSILAALIEAGATSLYRNNGDAPIIDGDDPLAFSDHSLNFTRVNITGGGQIRVVHNGVGDIGALFSTGALSTVELHFQTAESVIAVTLDNDSIDTGALTPQRLFYDLSSAELATLQAIASGTRLIFSITEPDVVVPEAVAFEATTGQPTADFNLSAIAPPSALAVALMATAGDPTASFALTAVAPAIPEAVAFEATAGDPTAAFALSAVAPPAAQSVAFEATAGDPVATFDLTAVAPSASVSVAFQAETGAPTASFDLSAVAPPAAVSVAFEAEAGLPTASFDLTATEPGGPQAVAFQAESGDPTAAFDLTAVAPLLVLADSDDTGLEVDAKALMVASDDATTGNFFYEDEDRGGTDTPLDGELGLGDDETLISGFRRRTATLLQLNDSNSPVALDIGDYFSTGGAGNDLTIYLQTLAGEVSFPATNASFSRADQVRFTLPADAQTLLDNLADGDLWIFKAARPDVQALAMEAAAGDPTADFDLTAVAPPASQGVAFEAGAGAPVATFDLTSIPPGAPESVAFQADAGDPVATFDLSVVDPPAAQAVSIEAEAGLPTATFNLTATGPGAAQAVAFEAEAGAPTAAFALSAVAPPPTQAVSFDATAGDPVATFDLTSVPTVAPETVSFSARAGDPVASFDLTAVPPPDAVSVAFEATAGEPIATFDATVIAPLLLSEFVVPDGRTLVFSAVIQAELSGENIYWVGNDGSILDGDLELTSDITINRIRSRSGPRIHFGRSGGGNVADVLETGGDLNDGVIHVQDFDNTYSVDIADISAADIGNSGFSVQSSIALTSTG